MSIWEGLLLGKKQTLFLDKSYEIEPKAALEIVLLKEDYFIFVLNFVWHRLNAILVMHRTPTAETPVKAWEQVSFIVWQMTKTFPVDH